MQSTNLLWTSGWDSTFRLVSLVSEGATVQPYYVRDRRRRSWVTELETQDRIKAALATDLILPTIVMEREDIPADPAITAAYEHLLSKAYIGDQYDWLSRMAHHLELSDLELSVHVDDRLYEHLKGHVRGDAISPEAPGELDFLRVFRFPILMLTKRDMEIKAKELGFSHIMEMTWFCFKPINGQPCGGCNPCLYTISEGLARRVPLKNRVRSRLRSVYTKLKDQAKRTIFKEARTTQ